jgi:hypothetical protein
MAMRGNKLLDYSSLSPKLAGKYFNITAESGLLNAHWHSYCKFLE